jgi:hypothetical protein
MPGHVMLQGASIPDHIASSLDIEPSGYSCRVGVRWMATEAGA